MMTKDKKELFFKKNYKKINKIKIIVNKKSWSWFVKK